MRLLLRSLLLSWLLLFSAVVAAAPEPPPQKLLKNLSRGINLSIWYTYRNQPGIDPARWYPADGDWAQLKALGLTHVRVQFDPAYFRDPDTPVLIHRERLAALKRDLAPAWANGLVVVLAAEPSAAEKALLARDDAAVAALAGFWRGFADGLKAVRPDRLVFELLNEPGGSDAPRNRWLMQTLVDAVRQFAPAHTLVVEGHGYSGIDELLAFEPLPAARLIYSFHFYEPFNFTHQGATWSWPMLQKLKGLPYPSSPDNVLPAVRAAEEDAKPHITAYGEQRWGRPQMETRLDLVRQWQQAHGVAVWCGEFGAARLGAPEDARQRWLLDARLAMEGRGIPWALFDYVGHFGLFSGNAGERQLDQPAAEALGLSGLARSKVH